MREVQIKICGITSVADGLEAAQAGVHAVGFVFWPQSTRFVEPELARTISAALPPLMARVGVFVDAPREVLVRTAETVGLDVLQLHGDERPEDLRGLPRRVVKALRVTQGFSADMLEPYREHAQGILLDAGHAGQPGGSGRTFDWSLAQAAREAAPYLILAGGLTPENVGQAIRVVKPDAVDVSGGVERAPGQKDPARIKAFVKAVRAA